MNKKYKLLLVFLLVISLDTFAWPGMPLPPLHVDGRNLKDDCGNNVVLHGVAVTPSPWFNGCMYGFSSKYCTWDNYDVQGALDYNKAVMDKLTSTSDGWYLNYIRLHIDPYWTNTPGPPIPENDISRFDYDRLVTYTDEVIIPLINHAKERGLYVILRPPGVCPERIAVNDDYHEYLKTIWTFLSQHPDLKNVDHVMFELANEPIEILGTNGVYGKTSDAHFEALHNFFQPIVDIIRGNGANNICWIPGSGWQSHYQGYVDYPITGGNIGYAVHIYPGYWGGIRNYQAFQKGWNENVKPIADIAPIAVTETDWAPEGYGAFGIASTGIEGGEGFGANLNYILNQSGNVSWNVLSPDNLIDHGDPSAGIAYNGDWEACAAPVKQWFREYAASNLPSCKLVQNGVYEIEFQADPNKVLERNNSSELHLSARDESVKQQWKAVETEDGYWRFESVAVGPDSSISLLDGSLELGTAIKLLPNSGDEIQEWQVTQLEDGYYKVLSKAALSHELNLGWDIPDCNVAGSQHLQTNEYTGSSCQKLKFNFIPHNPDKPKEEEPENPSPTGIEDIMKNSSIKVYPNPASNGEFSLSIPYSGAEIFQLIILTIEGKTVSEQRNLVPGINHIQTNLKKGVYILKINSCKSDATVRLMVE